MTKKSVDCEKRIVNTDIKDENESSETRKGIRIMGIENETEKIFNRQYERMKSELKAINMPDGYMTIISKYWDFLKQDIQERIMDYGNEHRL